MDSVLLVDDDDHFRQAMKMVLEDSGYKVVEASNGTAAKDLIPMVNPTLIISDIQMPHMTGVELLKWVKTNHTIPMVLMTGFSHILETHEAFNLGADGFLTKPFKVDELAAEVKKNYRSEKSKMDGNSPPETSSSTPDTYYFRVPIEDFVMGSTIPFCIYVKLGKEKYVRIAHTGEDVDSQQIQRFREKGVSFLYLTRTDFEKLIRINLKIGTAMKDKRFDSEKQKQFLHYTGEVLLEKVYVDGLDRVAFVESCEYSKLAVEVMSQDQGIFQLLESLNSHSDDLYTHSVTTMVISLMIAQKMEWVSPKILVKLGMAALLHDIGKKEIDAELLAKPRALLSISERQTVESHTIRGKEILSEIHGIPDEVVKVAYHHHENQLGQGFPQRLAKEKIHPMAKVVSLADRFSHMLEKHRKDPSQGDLFEKIQFIEEELYDRVVLKALNALIK